MKNETLWKFERVTSEREREKEKDVTERINKKKDSECLIES